MTKPKDYIEKAARIVYNIDFDGTLTTGEYTENPGPNKDMIQKVQDLYYTGDIIIIWSARWWESVNFMVAWLIRNNVPFHGIMMGKGGSDIYVDDKAINDKVFLED